MILVLQRGKLRQRETKYLAQSHGDSESGLTPRPLPGQWAWPQGPVLNGQAHTYRGVRAPNLGP